MSYYIAEELAPNLETLPTYILSGYIAELFPILKHCLRMPCAITWLG